VSGLVLETLRVIARLTDDAISREATEVGVSALVAAREPLIADVLEGCRRGAPLGPDERRALDEIARLDAALAIRVAERTAERREWLAARASQNGATP
jgi:phosphopantothenate synthetase